MPTVMFTSTHRLPRANNLIRCLLSLKVCISNLIVCHPSLKVNPIRCFPSLKISSHIGRRRSIRSDRCTRKI